MATQNAHLSPNKFVVSFFVKISEQTYLKKISIQVKTATLVEFCTKRNKKKLKILKCKKKCIILYKLKYYGNRYYQRLYIFICPNTQSHPTIHIFIKQNFHRTNAFNQSINLIFVIDAVDESNVRLRRNSNTPSLSRHSYGKIDYYSSKHILFDQIIKY